MKADQQMKSINNENKIASKMRAWSALMEVGEVSRRKFTVIRYPILER
jgi:hypothetical protein